MDRQTEWFCYHLTTEGLVGAEECRRVAEAVAAAGSDAESELGVFAQVVIENKLCPDVERLQKLCEMAVEEAKALTGPPVDVLGSAGVGMPRLALRRTGTAVLPEAKPPAQGEQPAVAPKPKQRRRSRRTDALSEPVTLQSHLSATAEPSSSSQRPERGVTDEVPGAYRAVAILRERRKRRAMAVFREQCERNRRTLIVCGAVAVVSIVCLSFWGYRRHQDTAAFRMATDEAGKAQQPEAMVQALAKYVDARPKGRYCRDALRRVEGVLCDKSITGYGAAVAVRDAVSRAVKPVPTYQLSVAAKEALRKLEDTVIRPEEQFRQAESLWRAAGDDRAKQADAFALYDSAAKVGHIPARYLVGWCCERGQGIAKDEKRAFACYKSAAESGLDDAYEALGRCYQSGIGTQKDDSSAAKWLWKAGEPERQRREEEAKVEAERQREEQARRQREVEQRAQERTARDAFLGILGGSAQDLDAAVRRAPTPMTLLESKQEGGKLGVKYSGNHAIRGATWTIYLFSKDRIGVVLVHFAPANAEATYHALKSGFARGGCVVTEKAVDPGLECDIDTEKVSAKISYTPGEAEPTALMAVYKPFQEELRSE